MKLQQKQSRVPLQFRQGLVAEVRASLKPGMEFNVVYGQLLSRLEKVENPSLEQAKVLLRNPETLLAEHEQRKASALKSQAQLKAQIVNANIPKHVPDREKLVADTLAFVNRFPTLNALEVKRVTILRQANGNRDLRTVPFSEIASPESLAEDLDCTQKLDDSNGEAGAHFSTSCQTFFLQENELLPSEKSPVPAPSLVEIS
jgi:hypothetical protein